MAVAVTNTGISIGQFLMAEDLNHAELIAFNLRQLGPRDVVMVRKVLEENWEDEEQMVSNLLQFPFLIPDDIRIESLKRGFQDLDCPYYILSSAVGLQRLDISESGQMDYLKEELKKSCLHEIGMVAMRAFITLYPHLKYPNDAQFIVSILQRPRSTLFQNALTWLILNVKNKNEITELLNKSCLAVDTKLKAEGFIEDHSNARNNGEDSNLALQFVNHIPSLNEFEAMLDKQDTLSDFFVELDADKDGKVSISEIQAFLEDIGKKVTIEELMRDLKSMEIDENVDKDAFIEIMFPRFQMK